MIEWDKSSMRRVFVLHIMNDMEGDEFWFQKNASMLYVNSLANFNFK